MRRRQPQHGATWWPLILLVMAFSSSAACRSQGTYYGDIAPPAERHLRIGLGASPATLDPHLAVGGPAEHIMLNLFEGLTEYDPVTAAPIPALAERWEVSPDATVYTFYLRHDARWSNGDPVTAHDFVYSWRRILDPATASPLAQMLYPIRNAAGFNQGKVRLRHKNSGQFLKDEIGNVLALRRELVARRYDPERYQAVKITGSDVGVTALDDYTLRVQLEHPTAYFLSLTPHWTFRPVHRRTIERWGRHWTRPEHIVVNGPYSLDEWQPGDKLILKKNQMYWGASRVHIERATFYLAENAQALLNLYRVGAIDTLVTGILPLEQIPLLRRKRDYVSGPYLSLYFYLINVSRPPLNQKDVRSALNMGIDRRQICTRLLLAGQRPAHALAPSLVSPSEGPRFNPSEAKRLMSQAGFPGGEGIRLRVTFNSLGLNRQIAEAIQAQWRQVFPEMQVELVNLEWQVYLSAMRQKNFDLIRRHWTADYTDAYSFLELMLSTSSNNPTGWANSRYDRLLHQANATVNPAQRLKLMATAERILLEDMPFIPIYQGVTFFLTKPYVHGWKSNILDKHPLKFVWIDPHWTRPGVRAEQGQAAPSSG